MRKIITFFKDNPNNLFALLAAVVGGFFLIEIVYYVIFLNTWLDEANYAYKSWLSAKDLASPFIDFRSKYPPFAFYSQMIFQDIVGPTIIGARVLSSFFLIGSALLIFSICKRMGNRWIGLLGVSLLVFHPYIVGYYTSVTPYAMTAFFALLSIWFLELPNISTGKKVVFASVAMALSMLVRYNMMPALIILWIFIFFRHRSFKYLGISVISSLVVIGVFMIPYAVLDFEYAIIWFALMFGPLANLLPFEYFDLVAGSDAGAAAASFFSLLNGHYIKILIDVFIKYFHLWVIFGAGILLIPFIGKQNLKVFFERHSILVLFFFLALALFATHFIIPSNQNVVIHSLYFAPFLLVTATGILALFYSYAKEKKVWEHLRLPFVATSVAMILLSPISVALSGPDIIFFNHFEYADSDLNRIKRGALYLQSVTTPEDTFLALESETLNHIFLAKRYIIPSISNGSFTFVDHEDNEALERYNLYNASMLLSWLRERADVVVFQKGRLEKDNVLLNGRGTRGLQDAEEFRDILESKFELIGTVENTYHRKNAIGEGVLQIYRRKSD